MNDDFLTTNHFRQATLHCCLTCLHSVSYADNYWVPRQNCSLSDMEVPNMYVCDKFSLDQ